MLAQYFDLKKAGSDGLKAYSLAMKAAGHIEHEDPLVRKIVGELRALTSEVSHELSALKAERARIRAIRNEVLASRPVLESRPSLQDIAKDVARRHGLTVNDLKAYRRLKHIAMARHEAFYLSEQLTLHSVSSIARFYGGRDHTTVLHGIRRHRARLEKNT